MKPAKVPNKTVKLFMTAIENGDVDGVRRLVGAHAALLGLTYKVKDGSQKVNTSPLGAAVSKGKCAVAEVLLDAGQYPDDSSGDKTMPWSLLFRKNAALDEQVRIALAELMRRKSPNDRALLNMVCDARDSRALHLAVAQNLIALTQWLISAGADPQVWDIDGNLPFDLWKSGGNRFVTFSVEPASISFLCTIDGITEVKDAGVCACLRIVGRGGAVETAAEHKTQYFASSISDGHPLWKQTFVCRASSEDDVLLFELWKYKEQPGEAFRVMREAVQVVRFAHTTVRAMIAAGLHAQSSLPMVCAGSQKQRGEISYACATFVQLDGCHFEKLHFSLQLERTVERLNMARSALPASYVQNVPADWVPGRTGRVELPESSYQFRYCSELLNRNVAQHSTDFGTVDCVKGGKAPVGFQLVRVERIQEPLLWMQYVLRKEAVRAREDRNADFQRYIATRPVKTELLDARCNEYHLFHGTNVKIAEVIAQKGFEARVGRDNGRFGAGVYFAEYSSKSNQYTPCPHCGAPNPVVAANSGECKCGKVERLFPMFVARVLLGDVHVALDKQNFDPFYQQRLAPLRNGSQFDRYDSVFGETVEHGGSVLLYREMVIYDNASAYPEFLMWYRRV